MDRLPIVSYALAWNPNTKHGQASITTSDGKILAVPIASAAEFTAVAAVLKESPVFLDLDGRISTNWEPVD
jgi:hypothetical protein